MLRTRKIFRYTIPKYPAAEYHEKRRGTGAKLCGKVLVPASILALLDSCTTGTMGPPPVRCDMLTENEGRVIIEHYFRRQGIVFKNDVKFHYHNPFAKADREVVLDGYNETLKIGYEFLADNDPHGNFDYMDTSILSGRKDARIFIAHNPCNTPISKAAENIEISIRQFIRYLGSQGTL